MKPLSATDAVKAIEAGTLTSEKLVQASLDRIAERDPVVKAWVHLDPALALAQARAADLAKGGLLRGVPIGGKDIIDTHDMPPATTRRSSRARSHSAMPPAWRCAAPPTA